MLIEKYEEFESLKLKGSSKDKDSFDKRPRIQVFDSYAL